ncbi:MAG: hypothetical protein A2314_01510 [Elusimicrobia bacterium RIFOXYB2_FULL_50_12]|nr:MAG: hypothetical protein A2314_01510 [Elusimicrobia bacterium RIFOXYB2_FULL_50_12]
MRRVFSFIGTALLLGCAILTIKGQDLLPGKRTFSILGSQRPSILSSPESSELTVSSPATTVGVSSITMDTSILPLSPTPQERAGNELAEFLENKKCFTYSHDRWLKMRKTLENGRTPGEDDVGITTASKPAPLPLPPGLSVDLPYESQLSISGRKTIGVAWKSTIFDKPESQRRVNSSSLDMTQELQVRIKGRVGRKINVNVDFDDTSADKRDISVIYKGDPEEVVQEAAFGDITMSLPSTEFVGYSRQLFGVKLDAKYKKMRGWGFFSRTKGLSEVKRFSGNTKLERKIIPDTAYIAQKYYLIKFNGDSIKSGTVKVYRDDRNQSNNNINTSSNTVTETLADGFTTTANTFTGNFDTLAPGQDYTVDYDRGIIVFRSQVPANYVIAVDYQKEDGSFLRDSGNTPGAWKILKDESNTAGITRELKTFYSLGNVKVIRDNGRGNFLLRVEDLNGGVPSILEPGGKPAPSYPSNISVDFDNGIFNFEPPEGNPLPADLYTYKNHRYNIMAEYRYRIKFVSLRPGIVPQSERVTMDGKVLARDTDYFIDYDAGIVTFYNEGRIDENTVIEVAYDYAPFGSSGGSTLVGLRSELSLTDNIFVGSSFIYDFAAKPLTVPDVRTTPSSLMVFEADSRVQNVKVPHLPLNFSAGGEIALSNRNPNIMDGGKAIVESMEGIKQEDNASLYYESWQPGATPSGARYYKDDISWNNEDVSEKTINPAITDTDDEKQQVLSIDYDLTRSNEVSIVQPFSATGIDFSRKLYIETWIYGDGKGEDITFGYGSFSEDVDSSGALKTEDINNDGTLNPGEDTGWEFINPDGTVTRVGAGNGKIDTADLDTNGSLNRIDWDRGPFGAGSGKTMTDATGEVHASVNWTGWRLFKIPLSILQPLDWQTIKQVRITVGGSGQKGTVKIAGISVVGNKWEPAGTFVEGSSLTISGINNEDDSLYVSLLSNPDYESLYDIQDSDTSERKEQALALNYSVNTATVTELATKLTYGRPYDLSNYKIFNLFVYGNGRPEDTFFIQIGNDTNYYEYSTPINWAGWRRIAIYQHDVNRDNKPDQWAVNSLGDATDAYGAVTKHTGSPSFQNISQIKLGVRAAGPKTASIWVNDIYVTDSWVKNGQAWRANVDFNVPGWASFGAKRKDVNRNFETFSAGIYNRDYLEDAGYFNFNRIQFLPISTNLTRTLTVTPSVVQNQSDLVSVLEEGRVVNFSGSASANLNLGQLPRIGGTYNRSITDTQQLKQLEDRETWTGSLSYSNPLRLPVLPTGFSANYSVSNSFFRPWVPVEKSTSTSFLGLDALNDYLKIKDYNTLEISESWSGQAPFQFWNGFTLSPSYSLRRVREKNKAFDKDHEEYPKSAGQGAGASSSLRLFNWLVPTFTYNINTNESYNLTYSSGPVVTMWPGRTTKYIERASNGEVSLNFQVKDIIKFPYTQSLGFSSSYRFQDNDSYDNVPSSYTAIGLDQLWVRDSRLSFGTTDYVNKSLRSLIKRDDIRLNGRYNPFEAFLMGGRLSAIKTFSTNFTYTRNEEHTYNTGTQSDTYTKIWPDIIFSISRWEQLVWLEKWLSDTQLNFRHQKKFSEKDAGASPLSKNENYSYGSDARFYLLKKIDINFSVNSSGSTDHDLTKMPALLTQESSNLSWSGQAGVNIRRWRFTGRYDNGRSSAKDGTGKLTQHLLNNTYTLQVYSDMSFPNGLPIPFTNRTLPLTNRLIYNANIKYAQQTSLLNVGRDNTNSYGLSMNADYEVSQNFRAALGMAWTRTENRDLPDENFQTIEASGRLTIQF